MNRLLVSIIVCLLMIKGYGQPIDRVTKLQQKRLDSMDRLERRSNIYANRKYGLSISWSPYAHIAHKVNTFGALDITFSNRFTWLDVGRNGSLEANMGISFEPYQGTKLNMGFDYEFLPKKYKAHPYVGTQYSLGLAQANTTDGNAYIQVGFHSYVMPFMGVMWWPGKEDISSPETAKKYLYQHPRFRQLFYFKFELGYSYLLGSVKVDTTGAFSDHLYQIIRNNTANTIQCRLAIGLNIPTSGRKRKQYFELLESRQLKVE